MCLHFIHFCLWLTFCFSNVLSGSLFFFPLLLKFPSIQQSNKKNNIALNFSSFSTALVALFGSKNENKSLIPKE